MTVYSMRKKISALLEEASMLDGRFALHDYCGNDIRSIWLAEASSLRQQAERLRIKLRKKRAQTAQKEK